MSCLADVLNVWATSVGIMLKVVWPGWQKQVPRVKSLKVIFVPGPGLALSVFWSTKTCTAPSPASAGTVGGHSCLCPFTASVGGWAILPSRK